MAKTPAPIAKQLARLPVATSLTQVQRVISRQCSHRRTFSSQPDMVHVARDNFKRWNDALQTKDAAAVANLYDASNLSFLPTVSPQHIKGAEDTKLYFKDFVMKNPFGTITDDSVQVYNNGNAYLHSGLYTFELGESGNRTPVEARFSYVWSKIDGEWKITHHHSSVSPS